MICGGRRGGGRQRALTRPEAPLPGAGTALGLLSPLFCADGEGSELESRQFCVKGPSCLSILAALPSLTPTSGCPLCLQNYPGSDQLSHLIASALCGLRHLSPVSAQLPPGWSPCLHLAPLSILHTPAPVRHCMSPLSQNPPVTPALYRVKARLLFAASWPCRSALATFSPSPQAPSPPHFTPATQGASLQFPQLAQPSLATGPLHSLFPCLRQLPPLPSSGHRLPSPLPQVPVQMPPRQLPGPLGRNGHLHLSPRPWVLFFRAFSAI